MIIGIGILIAGGIVAYLAASQFQFPAVFTSSKISLEPTSVTIVNGSTFTINIKVAPGGSVAQVYAWRTNINYPVDLLELISATGSSIDAPSLEAIAASVAGAQNGIATVLAADAYISPLLAETSIEQLIFRAKKTGTATITLSEGIIRAKNEASAQLSNSVITIQ